MSTPDPTQLQDAEPDAARDGNRPTPTPAQSRLFQASLALLDAQRALGAHAGPYSGPEWSAKTKIYRERWEAFEAACDAIGGGAK